MGAFIKLNNMKRKKIKIPLNRPTLTKKDIDYLRKSATPNLFSEEIIKKFEKKFADYIGRKYAMTTSSGTAALHLALLSLGIKEEDEVICPSYTCVALLNAINYLGAKPELVDCNFDVKKEDFNISFSELKNKITSKTKAVIVPHMFGYPAEIDKIINLKIPVIEDATQALGNFYHNKKLGSYGIISFFSLHYSKMITTGMGGILLTDSKELFERARFLGDYEFTIISQRLKSQIDYWVQYNYKMSDLNAVLGISQLSQVNQFIKKRREIAKIYSKSFKKLAEVPLSFKNHNFWRYIIRTKKDPREVIKKAMSYGIEAGRGVYPPLHRYLKMSDKLFPNTEKAILSLIAIPLYPSLNKKEINYIIKVFKKIL